MPLQKPRLFQTDEETSSITIISGIGGVFLQCGSRQVQLSHLSTLLSTYFINYNFIIYPQPSPCKGVETPA